MKCLKLIALTLLALFIAACNKEKIHDVKYYLDHPDERKAQLERCQNNPGEFKDTPNCENAERAWLDAPFDPKSLPKIR